MTAEYMTLEARNEERRVGAEAGLKSMSSAEVLLMVLSYNSNSVTTDPVALAGVREMAARLDVVKGGV
jgi:hypothetical protein